MGNNPIRTAKRKKMFNEDSLTDLWNNIMQPHTHINRRRKEARGTKHINQIVAENFPNLRKKTYI